jgi:putative DNA primase/helicase
VAASETEDGARLAEALLKQVTGGDRIAARYLYGNHIEFDPTHKIWLATNHLPQVRNNDEAVWRRLLRIPFVITIPEQDREKNLATRLVCEEGSGILNWFIEGCRAWQADGLGHSDAVTRATAEYRRDQDVFGRFLEDCCEHGAIASASAAELYGAYTGWATSMHLEPTSQAGFGKKLKELGFERRRVGHEKTHTWFGVGLAGGAATPRLKVIVNDHPR